MPPRGVLAEPYGICSLGNVVVVADEVKLDSSTQKWQQASPSVLVGPLPEQLSLMRRTASKVLLLVVLLEPLVGRQRSRRLAPSPQLLPSTLSLMMQRRKPQLDLRTLKQLRRLLAEPSHSS